MHTSTTTPTQYYIRKSVINKSQDLIKTKDIFYEGKKCIIEVKIKYNDECNNGHNTFSITGDIKTKDKRYSDPFITGGCIHDKIVKYFPKLQPYIKWHLVSSDEPMYYIENSLFWAGYTQYKEKRNIDNLKSTCIYGALEEDFNFNIEKASKEELVKWLEDRKPKLMLEFKKAVESLGFTW